MIRRKTLAKLNLALFVIASCLATACINIAGDWHYHEYKRVTSPDSALDAVLTQGSGMIELRLVVLDENSSF